MSVEKDTVAWTLTAWVALNQPWIVAGVISLVMSLLRALYFEHRISGKHVAEAGMCFVFVSVSRPVFEPLPQVNDDGALLVGALVGVAGARVMIPLIERIARAFGGRYGG